MFKIRFAINALATLVFTLALASLAEASQQTFVSTSGNDDGSGTCDRYNPCRTFNMAVLHTENGGEVIALDSGEYGTFSTNRLVSVIAAPGVHAQITATSGDAINFSGPSGSIVLRGLTILGHGTGTNGITSFSLGTLYVENCVIDGFAGGAINFQQNGKLFVKDTIVRNNGQSSFAGIYIAGGIVSIDHCTVENNGYGIVIDGGRITIRDSVVSGNVRHGFWARGFNMMGASNIENCMVTDNGTGIGAGSGSRSVTVLVSNTTITGNTYGVGIADGCSIFSFRNNRLDGNQIDGSFSLGGPGLK
jgi:hypothetical protein